MVSGEGFEGFPCLISVASCEGVLEGGLESGKLGRRE